MPIDFLATEHVLSYLTLTFLEIVLAADNLVLIAILAGRLPEHQRPLARRIGIIAAVVTRLLLLVSLFWLSHLERPIPMPLTGDDGQPLTVTPREIVFTLGGLFLIWKALAELGVILATRAAKAIAAVKPWRGFFALTILQIAIFDLIFSLDSVIAAIGIAKHIEVMIAAVLTATLVMVVLVNPISNFIDRHPTVKLVALNFLVLIGALLLTEAAGMHVETAYFYVALVAAILAQIVFIWFRDMAPAWRIVILFALFVLAAIVTASLQADLSPMIGKSAATSLRDLIQTIAVALMAALEWLQQQLART
jgi:predicted tellurium resistance membrane protein TerC